MTPEDRPRFARMLTALMVTFDREISPELTTIWWSACEDLTIERFTDACGEYIKHGKYPPKPSDIRERAGQAPVTADKLIAMARARVTLWDQVAYAHLRDELNALTHPRYLQPAAEALAQQWPTIVDRIEREGRMTRMERHCAGNLAPSHARLLT